MLYTINDKRYLEIINATRNIYNSEISKYKDDIYDQKEKIKDIYSRFNHKFPDKKEKQIFYLNLLVINNKKALNELTDLYNTYLDVDPKNEIKPLEYYKKFFAEDLYNEKYNIIIEYFMAYYDLTPKEAYYKVNELIQYRKVIKYIYHAKNDNMITKPQPKVVSNDEIDLLKEMRKFNTSNQFEHFEFSDKVSKTK